MLMSAFFCFLQMRITRRSSGFGWKIKLSDIHKWDYRIWETHLKPISFRRHPLICIHCYICWHLHLHHRVFVFLSLFTTQTHWSQYAYLIRWTHNNIMYKYIGYLRNIMTMTTFQLDGSEMSWRESSFWFAITHICTHLRSQAHIQARKHSRTQA